jgi:uncharacterized protein (TIGR03435 family)
MVTLSVVTKHFSRKSILVAVFVAGLAFHVCGSVVDAQSQAQDVAVPVQPPAFDVISVKPNNNSLGAHGLITTQFTADGFRGTNVPVHVLLLQAYGLHEGESFGEPTWASTEVFDIEAKVAGPDVVAFSKLDSDQHQAMIRQILAERFKLTAHRESRELPVFVLSIAKSGSKLKESMIDPSVPPSERRGGGVQMSMGRIAAHECTISYFLTMLSRQMGRSILDRTGLTGNYDFTLRWNPDNGLTTAAEDTQADALPSVFTAVQEQMGLKLESTKAPTEVLVVDHLERPTQN